MSHAQNGALRKTASLILTAALLVMCVFCAAVPASAVSDAQTLMSSITNDYSAALQRAGRSSFHGYCNLATAYQLLIKGVYSGGLDYSGNGKAWYSHFNDIVRSNPNYKTSGGYYAVTYGGSNCLYDLIADYGSDIRLVAYCLGTGGSSGDNHIMLISAIINNKVYFADSFGYYYNGYNPEGTAMCMPLDEFISAYVKMNGYPNGCIYFTKDRTKTPNRQAEFNDNSSSYVPTPQTPAIPYEYYDPGVYLTTVRTGIYRLSSGTSTIGGLSGGSAITITAISGSRGELSTGGFVNLSDVIVYPAPAIVSVISQKLSAVGGNSTISWVVDSDGGIGNINFTYTVYDSSFNTVTTGKSSDGSISYAPTSAGEYTLFVTATDSNGVSSSRNSDPVTLSRASFRSPLTYQPGDVDGDGFVTARDSRMILRVSAYLDSLRTSSAKTAADIDGDGRVSASDARKALRMSAGL